MQRLLRPREKCPTLPSLVPLRIRRQQLQRRRVDPDDRHDTGVPVPGRRVKKTQADDTGNHSPGVLGDHIQQLATAVGVGTFATYNTGNNVFQGGNGRRLEYPSDTPFGTAPPDPVVAPDIVLAVTQLDQMAGSVPVDRPWDASQSAEWDRQTLDTWLRANTSGNAEFMAVTSAATEAIFGGEPRDLSLLGKDDARDALEIFRLARREVGHQLVAVHRPLDEILELIG